MAQVQKRRNRVTMSIREVVINYHAKQIIENENDPSKRKNN